MINDESLCSYYWVPYVTGLQRFFSITFRLAHLNQITFPRMKFRSIVETFEHGFIDNLPSRISACEVHLNQPMRLRIFCFQPIPSVLDIFAFQRAHSFSF